MLRVKFQIQPVGSLAALTAAFDGASRVELDNAIFIAEDRWMEYFTITDIASEAVVVETLSELENCRVPDPNWIMRRGKVYHLLLLVEENTPFIITTVAKIHAVPHRLFVTNNRLTAVVSVQDWDHLKELAEYVEARYDAFELLGTSQSEAIGVPLGSQHLRQVVSGKLTKRQLVILETAYQLGYFKVPRQTNGQDVADELDISDGALSEQLRDAENELLNLLFDME